MLHDEINETIARLDRVAQSLPTEKSVAMGSALFGVCVARSLVSFDARDSGHRNPRYRGGVAIQPVATLSDWEFQVGPSNV